VLYSGPLGRDSTLARMGNLPGPSTVGAEAVETSLLCWRSEKSDPARRNILGKAGHDGTTSRLSSGWGSAC